MCCAFDRLQYFSVLFWFDLFLFVCVLIVPKLWSCLSSSPHRHTRARSHTLTYSTCILLSMMMIIIIAFYCLFISFVPYWWSPCNQLQNEYQFDFSINFFFATCLHIRNRCVNVDDHRSGLMRAKIVDFISIWTFFCVSLFWAKFLYVFCGEGAREQSRRRRRRTASSSLLLHLEWLT